VTTIEIQIKMPGNVTKKPLLLLWNGLYSQVYRFN